MEFPLPRFGERPDVYSSVASDLYFRISAYLMGTRCARLAEACWARHSWLRPSHWIIIQGAARGNESGAGTTVGAALRARMFLPVPVLDGVKQTDDRLVGQVPVSRDTCESSFLPFLICVQVVTHHLLTSMGLDMQIVRQEKALM